MSDRLRYLNRGQLREEIAYAAGVDPDRYGIGAAGVGFRKAHVRKIAVQLQPDSDHTNIDALELRGLYYAVCEWADGEYQPNAGNAWGINRENLKAIHRALDAAPPREVVSLD